MTNNDKISLIIVVSAPSGCGKTTLVEQVIKEMPEMRFSISCTTRRPRQGEEEKKEYYFISEENFKKKIQNKEFLEWEEKFGNYYGTPLSVFQNALDNGEDIILSIDVKGAAAIKAKFPESISVFIMPPSTKELENRLRGRNTDVEEEVEMRIGESKEEMKKAGQYDYLIINEDLSKAAKELISVIKSEKNRETTKKGRE